MKKLIALILPLLLVGCVVTQFPGYLSDPYSGLESKFWGKATSGLYERNDTLYKERLSDFRSCKRDVTLINKTDWQKGDALNECMVALGYRPLRLAKTHWVHQNKFD